VEQVSDVMSDDSSISKVLLLNVIRLVIIFVVCGLVYALARIVSVVLGGDIVKEEEVVIVHEHATKEEAAKARASLGRGKTKRQ